MRKRLDGYQQYFEDSKLLDEVIAAQAEWCEVTDDGTPWPKLTYLSRRWHDRLRMLLILALRVTGGPATVDELVELIYNLGYGVPYIPEGMRGFLGDLQSLMAGVCRVEVVECLDYPHDKNARWVLRGGSWDFPPDDLKWW